MTRRSPDRRSGSLRLVTAAAGLLVGLLVACADNPTEPDGPQGPARLLVVTHTTGFRHSSIGVAESVLADLAASSGQFTVSYSRTGADVVRDLAPGALADIDGVFFANTTGNLGMPDVAAFVAWIEAGHGFMGAHSAADTYHDEPAYLQMLGGEFVRHGAQAQVALRAEQANHPATTGLPQPYTVFDEIYEFRSNPRGTATVLLSADRHPDDGHAEAGQPGDYPLSWTREPGAGRVFYTALGHREDVWMSPQFQQHVLGGIRWALRLP